MKQVNYLKKIIRVRRKLIQMNKSGISQFEARKRLQEIEKYVDAYGAKYGEEYWKGFLKRRKADILYLIHANKAEEAYIKELNELI